LPLALNRNNIIFVVSLLNNITRYDMTLEVNDATFESLVIQSDKPVIVDFWAEWCGPCRVIGPIVKEIADDFEGKVVVVKMDVDNNPVIPAKFGIRNIPTVLFFKGGQVVDKQVGAVPKTQLVNKLQALL
jgi:thioredoxin 1